MGYITSVKETNNERENEMQTNTLGNVTLAELEKLPRTLSIGRWAVAIVGMRAWRRDSAIGDGYTTATAALLTRCETEGEAVALAARWNAAQPAVLPGSQAVFVYASMPYRRADYIGRQNLSRYQARDCDRRIG